MITRFLVWLEDHPVAAGAVLVALFLVSAAIETLPI